MIFTRAITRIPSRSISNGLTSAKLGVPSYDNAIKQHKAYVAALESLGLKVDVLPAMEEFADATFVEDVALLADQIAIITSPGAPSRAGEVEGIIEPLKQYFDDLRYIKAPGKLEAGDVMRVGDHFFFGLSDRTNSEGAQQAIKHLESVSKTGSVVSMNEMLHLKTGVNYLGGRDLLVVGEFITHPAFASFNRHEVPSNEAYAANSLRINDRVIVPKGFEQTKAIIETLDYNVLEVDTSEFRKIDGGLSCLSLRF